MHLNEIVFLADATTAPAAPVASSSAAAAPGAPAQPQAFGNMLFLIVIMGVMMYFVLIRPQSQQRKQQAKLLEALKSGDKVVTSSGIVGIVITVKDSTVSLRSADAKMEVTKASVVQILEGGAAVESKPT
jgi:preprotein translocase subunit YajC